MYSLYVEKNEYDLNKLQNEIQLIYPYVSHLCSKQNTICITLTQQPSYEEEQQIISIVAEHLPLTDLEKDLIKYETRASVKDRIIAEMASENMERVRNGIWTVDDLISLTQNTDLKLILDDIHTLSFELAVDKLAQINNPLVTNPLITEEIKNGWIQKLQSHFYNT